MDNVNDKTLVPLPEQTESLKTKRRIGLGILGYGSALMMMEFVMVLAEAIRLTEQLGRFMMNGLTKLHYDRKEEKGAFPLFDKAVFKSRWEN